MEMKFGSIIHHIFEYTITLLRACHSCLSICFEKLVESSSLAICEVREALSGTEGVVGERPIMTSVAPLVSMQATSI